MNKSGSKTVWLVLIVFLALAGVRFIISPKGCLTHQVSIEQDQKLKDDEHSGRRQGPPSTDPAAFDRFPRDTAHIIYTRHARCRMACRHVDETEVKWILKNGTINAARSDLRAHPDPKYALEGISADGQHLRIIFAPTPRGMVVITCIDLENDWTCDCP